MRKYSASESGVFNPRLLFALAFCTVAALLAVASLAINPPSGTLSPSNREITYSGGPFVGVTNPSDNAAGPVTCDQADPCEDFGLTIDIPQSYKDAHPTDVIKIEISWDDPSGGQDLDAWLVNNPDDTNYPAHATNGADNPEVMTVTMDKITAGPHQYFVRVAPFISTGQAYTGKITLVTPSAAGPVSTPAPFVGIAPRYYNYAPGPGVGETAGEPSIGYNLTSHRAMYISGLQTLRVTFPEELTPKGSIPVACDALWEDVSYVVTKTKSLDPILFTDQRTGRTFVSQLDSVVPPASPVLIGLNSFMAYTDDDGATWTPAQVNPPDGSYDHQTVGGGPYPASVPLGNPVNKGDAIYYCSQAGVTAFCSRSDDGGLNFGRSTPIYNAATDGCGGIHGHVKVAPDGTVYVPNRGCSGVQAVTVSEDAGITWTVRKVQGQGFSAKPPPGILDPSLGIASDGTLYFSWISNESDGGHAHVAVSKDKGVTWSKDYDLGASQGLHNGVFIEAVAGDPNRAAVGFIGTTEAGDHEADTFKGTWYAFIATTYDGGQTWATVNATPNAPVQREAGIWNEGGSSPLRNLLDFNEITMDEKGRVFYAFADGCVDDCENGPPNSFSSKATIARQSGGRGLLAQFDPSEPTTPQRACLSGRRDDMASYLRWRVPDNGGAALTSYKIFRGTSAGNEVLIGQTGGGKTSYNDRTANPAVPKYTYKIVAVNPQGDGAASNIVELTVGPRLEPTGACELPGVQVLVDPTGDESDGLPQHDITSVSMSEPQALAGNIVFTIKVVNLATLPPAFRWAVRFSAPQHPPDHPVLGPQEDWFVGMVTSDNATPTFTYGTTGVFQGASRFFVTLGNLNPASNFNADGTITLVLPKSGIGSPTPGQALTGLFGSVRASLPSAIPGTGGTNETIPDSTGTSSYALRSANLCLPNTAPLAVLNSDIQSGPNPTTVNFSAAESSDLDSVDTIASYTFDFGEGQGDVTQSSPTISHTFNKGGLYDVKLVVTDSRGKLSSNTAHRVIEITQTASPSAAQLLNISSRLRVQTGDNVLIGGFIIIGSDPKKVALRAIGPSTKVLGLLDDPTLELHDGTGALVTSNDDWKDSPERSQIEAANLAPGDDRESVILRTLNPGAYTAVVRGKNNTTGIGVVEAYDLDPTNNSKMANLSTRGFVETGDNILIGGFITGNRNGNINVLVRAIGPSLAGLVPNPLSDPTLELHDGNGTIMATNDNWQDTQQTDIQQTGIPPTDPHESAILAQLPPGNFTAIVRGVGTATGNSLVEVYNVP
jgi:hypothetical protein